MHRIAFFAALLFAAPAFAEAPVMKPATPATAPVQQIKSAPAPVDINSATIDQLSAVPGLTRTQAEAIVKGRPFKSVMDLASVKILPPDALALMKEHLTVGK